MGSGLEEVAWLLWIMDLRCWWHGQREEGAISNDTLLCSLREEAVRAMIIQPACQR